jgi:predicted HTH domain antitoxin
LRYAPTARFSLGGSQWNHLLTVPGSVDQDDEGPARLLLLLSSGPSVYSVDHECRFRIVIREMPLDQATREELVMGLFRRGKISAGKACALLGLERLDFVRRAGELGVPVYLTTEEEWERERATIDSWLKP